MLMTTIHSTSTQGAEFGSQSVGGDRPGLQDGGQVRGVPHTKGEVGRKGLGNDNLRAEREDISP